VAVASPALVVALSLLAGGTAGAGDASPPTQVAPPARGATRAEWDAWNKARARAGLLPRKAPPHKPRTGTMAFPRPAPAVAEPVEVAMAGSPGAVLEARAASGDLAAVPVNPAPESARAVAAASAALAANRAGRTAASAAPLAGGPAALADASSALAQIQAPSAAPAPTAAQPAAPIASTPAPAAAPPLAPAPIAAPGAAAAAGPGPAAAPPATPGPPAPADAGAIPQPPPGAPGAAGAAVLWEHREASGRSVRITRDAAGALVAQIRAPDGSPVVEIVLFEPPRAQ
jgi:ribonuclease E